MSLNHYIDYLHTMPSAFGLLAGHVMNLYLVTIRGNYEQYTYNISVPLQLDTYIDQPYIVQQIRLLHENPYIRSLPYMFDLLTIYNITLNKDETKRRLLDFVDSTTNLFDVYNYLYAHIYILDLAYTRPKVVVLNADLTYLPEIRRQIRDLVPLILTAIDNL